MILTAVTNILTIYHYQNLQKYDSRIVNMAGRQRMLSQKISKLALSVSNGRNSDRPLLSEAIMLYDSSLRILQHGGKTKKDIIPSAPGIMENLFEKTKDVWGLFKENARITKSLLSFARGYKIEKITVSINTIISDALSLSLYIYV